MGGMISSLHNSRVKDVVRLRDRRGRSRQARILIDGARELRRALDAGWQLTELFVCTELATSDDARATIKQASAAQDSTTDIWYVTQAVFERLAFGDRADGVVGVASRAEPTLADLNPPLDSLIVVVEGVEKPGNLGVILRSADGAGVGAVILCDGGTDWYNPNVIRASLGTVFTVPVASASTSETIDWLRRRGTRILAARVEGAVRYWDVSWNGPVALVLGAEAAGLSDVWTGPDVAAVTLPMLGIADSLNVSATAAVLCYEALRQRSTGKGAEE